jgi:hypothetical protein
MTSSRRLHVAIGALAVVVGVAAVWLWLQTRSPSVIVESRDSAPTAVAMVASDAPRARTNLPVMPVPTPDASGVVHQTVAERDAAKAQRTKWVHSAISSPRERERWTDQGQALIDEVSQRAAHVEDNGCFLQGCTATLTFPSRAAYDSVYSEIITSDAYAAWTGGKRWSTPEEQDDGRIVVALIIYRPN